AWDLVLVDPEVDRPDVLDVDSERVAPPRDLDVIRGDGNAVFLGEAQNFLPDNLMVLMLRRGILDGLPNIVAELKAGVIGGDIRLPRHEHGHQECNEYQSSR